MGRRQEAATWQAALPGDWLTVSDSDDFPQRVAPAALRTLLGREFRHAVFDARHGFHVAAFAALGGTLRAGSLAAVTDARLERLAGAAGWRQPALERCRPAHRHAAFHPPSATAYPAGCAGDAAASAPDAAPAGGAALRAVAACQRPRASRRRLSASCAPCRPVSR